MAPDEAHHKVDERELAALADGSLEGRARLDAERRIGASPALSELLAEQRRAAAAIRAIDVRAPAPLRERLDRRAERRARPWRPLAAAACATAAVVAVAVALAGGGSARPSVAAIADLGMRAPTGPPPAPARARPVVLDLRAEGVPYPNLAIRYGWRPVGQRSDRVAGRRATTVFYARDGRIISYAVVSGQPLPAPSGARVRVEEGTREVAFSAGGRNVVTWERLGHSCVLSANATRVATLADLAAWNGGGRGPS